ncbi:MAG TPA: class I SAM-dependent methyltransferase [Melioribacteraceae bacterium]|nr:class I SAM-dependent methyltransferase [Melioribacteraceae bacterium]
MFKNKNHWYDGWFYDKFIAPNQDRMFGIIKDLIKPNSLIIDVGCGTGRFSYSIADKSSKVVGIDLSEKNIKQANKNLQLNPNIKISFLNTDVNQIIKNKMHFD